MVNNISFALIADRGLSGRTDMQELEKILEEIEQRKARAEKLIVKPPHDKLDQVANDTAEAFIEAYKECQDIIRKHMNDGWIPVEECPPEEPKENPEFEGKKIELYLVTVKGTKYPFRAMWNGKFFTDGWSVLDVIAWHPLPEPYRPERSEGE